MIDLLVSTQDAAFAALSAAIPPELAAVYQHIPEGAQPPFIVVGDIEAEAFGGKDGGLEQHVLEINYVYRGKKRRDLLAMMHAGREALDGQSITADGASFGDPVWTSSATGAADDGVTYGGSQTYEIIVQPD
jgi:hypothetical protein